MRVLAVDAATENCSAALWLDGVIVERAAESGKPHAEELLAMVKQVLAQGGVALAELDGIAASIGPGAFTGVRISVAVAQGLAFGAGLRVVGVSTLEALALQALNEPGPDGLDRAVACLDARMQEVYWGCFAADDERGVVATTAARVGAPSGIVLPSRHVGIGRGFRAYPALGQLRELSLPVGATDALPRAREFARIGALRLARGENLDPADLQPLYLRDKVADTEAERAARAVT